MECLEFIKMEDGRVAGMASILMVNCLYLHSEARRT
jgi:hypothetical protein